MFKDLFYFNKSERIGIFFLLFLIICTWGCYFIFSSFSIQKVTTKNNQFEEEIIAFKKSLKPKSNKQKNTQYSYFKPDTNKKLVPNQIKKIIPKTVLVELNKADTTELLEIKGIGSVLASRIIKYRKLLRGYYSVNQLKEVYGIDSIVFQKISPFVTVNAELIIKTDINNATYNELKHPYLTNYQLKKIMDYKTKSKKIDNFDELIKNKVLTEESILKIMAYYKINSN